MLPKPPARQATLTSAENAVYQNLQHKLWADMQRVFPRLRDFASPRNQPKLRVRPLPGTGRGIKAERCDICGVLTEHTYKFPHQDPKGHELGQIHVRACKHHPFDIVEKIARFIIDPTLDKLPIS